MLPDCPYWALANEASNLNWPPHKSFVPASVWTSLPQFGPNSKALEAQESLCNITFPKAPVMLGTEPFSLDPILFTVDCHKVLLLKSGILNVGFY